VNIGVDIDKTLFKSELVNGEYKIIYVNHDLIEKVNAAHEAGYVIIIWTGRHWNHLKITKDQLDKYGVKYDGLQMAKSPIDVMVDDTSVQPEEFLKMKL